MKIEIDNGYDLDLIRELLCPSCGCQNTKMPDPSEEIGRCDGRCIKTIYDFLKQFPGIRFMAEKLYYAEAVFNETPALPWEEYLEDIPKNKYMHMAHIIKKLFDDIQD